MKIKAIIIDDEPSNREILKYLLSENCPEVILLGEAGDVQSGIQLIGNAQPDLVFLDIEMTPGNGFQVLEHFSSPDFKVIFTTAYDQYAIRAIKYSALDYLLKPIDPDELSQAVKRADVPRTSDMEKQIQALLHNIRNTREQPTKLIVSDKDGIELLHIPDISRADADGNYTTFFLRDNRRITASRPLRNFESLLEKHNFIRVHQSHMVNLECIARYVRGRGGYLVMKDGSEIEVSRNKKDELLSRLGVSGG